MYRKNKKIKKIAIFHCGFIYSGGGERIILEEISSLRNLGYLVDCYVPNYDQDLSYPDIIKGYGIKTFLPQLPKFIPLRFALQMVASCVFAPLLVLKYRNYDIFLGANQPGAYMAWVASKILGKPYFAYLSQPNRVLYPRDYEDWQNVTDYYFLSRLINSIFRKLVVWLDKKSITGGKNLFINGSFIAKEIVKIYKPSQWINCPGGAHLAPKSVFENNRFEGSIKVNGHTPSKPYILYTSRHEPWKRFDWAIEVLQKVLGEYPYAKLVIPGVQTTVTPRLQKLAQQLGIADKIIFTGPITQEALWRLYQNAAVYIFTSPMEDLGIVVQEAQAAATPVVAWNAGGPTVTVVSGKTGFLIKPYDKDLMASKIVFLLKNVKIRNEMGQAAWEHIKKNFSWERHAAILDREFQIC